MKRVRGVVHSLEEHLIAVILGLMTAITFANVVARLLNSNILWALELSLFLSAWLVLIGASYAVREYAHLGVDAIINILKPAKRRLLGIFATACCVLYAFLLFKGSWDYWAVFADLPPTSGRWFPTGFVEKFRSQSFYEVQDIPMIGLFSFLEGWINYDEPYTKLPKVIPYTILPISTLLLLFRFLNAGHSIVRHRADRLIVSHEAINPLDDDAQDTQDTQDAQVGAEVVAKR